ncbi:LysR family transcriptional regulator [Streptomyces mirabilis]|uniref:LysR family transcriptional regulator n=1 Tax=Streptomyces mirabilis TaxID=68239 RepID=A0ABU3V5H5_9ACTN|nr:LysR family transcriptional regulator [Streptomyces mirabilis]MCX5355775.1 LysR family transcriptional regulator [Streptomyces mirabilis]MDU9001417.1 LysR family transcriptional regulator [Streptomyces mirabilis]
MNTPEPPFRTTPSEPDVEPRLLRAFLAVAREGHFGHAASSIGVAQPALSRQVQQLERLLGVVLFDRKPRGAELTPGGRVIVPYAERALAHNHRLVRAARSVATGREGSVVLTVSAPLPGPPGGLLAETLRSFRTAHPHVQVSVTGLDDHDETAALVGGRVDAVLTWDEYPADGCASEALIEEHTSALLGREHPKARAPEVTVSELADEPLLFPLRERGHCWAQLQAAAQAARVGLNVIPTAPSAVTDLVAAGLGVSAVPASFRFAAHPDVAFVPIPGLYNRMSVMWRGDDDSEAVADFVSACRATARSLAAAHPDVWRPAHRDPAP